jgi:prepilin-type N-terminal cleavage/methylation domain-containing protein
MSVDKRGSADGFTLIEVLASVVLLSLFIGGLVLVTTEALSQAQLNKQKLAATMIGHDVIARLAVNGLDLSQIPQQVPANGVVYTVTVTTKPSITPGLTDVTANISWSTDVNTSPATMNVTVEQVLSQ